MPSRFCCLWHSGFCWWARSLRPDYTKFSRRHERGEPITYRSIASAVWSERNQLASFGMLLFVLYFFWMNVAFLLFMLFFGPASFPPIDEFISALLLTAPGQNMLVTGTAVGTAFAAVAYSISVIAVPMIFDRKVDAVTAMIASVGPCGTTCPPWLFGRPSSQRFQ